MYQDCNIINASRKHKFTFIMLHPMQCDSKYFYNFLNYFEKIKKIKFIFESIKFIFPEASFMDIDYPNNKQYNIQSWYNYYTCYNNINKIDKIDLKDFESSTNRIINIIYNEAFILNSFKHIYLVGVSQGGTLLFNILNKLPRSIGGLYVIKSIYMDKYIKLKKNIKTPIYIYSGSKDKVYNLNLQKICFQKLKNKKYNIKWTIVKNLDHHKIIAQEHDFIINNFLDSLYSIKL